MRPVPVVEALDAGLTDDGESGTAAQLAARSVQTTAVALDHSMVWVDELRTPDH